VTVPQLLAVILFAYAAGPAGIQNATMPTSDASPPLIRTTHIRLLVHDFDREFRFFEDVLGFKATFGKEGENYADFDCNGVCVALFKRALMSEDIRTSHKPAEADAQDRLALIFGVASVDDAVARLRKHHVAFVTEPHDRKEWGIRVAHFRDPDGNLIEMNQPLPN
jgi:catechol 2,3-dioxygenase-like lactoylglutathione lyase family enzyme